MERDFMGLNSKESVVVVKEEAVEGFKDSGVQCPLSNKVSCLPHFMTFKVAQEEKTAKVVSDPLASSGFTAAVDAFGPSHKCPPGEIQMLQAANQPISVSLSNPLFKSHFAGAGQNFAGATMRQHFLGGIPVTATHSMLPSLGSVAGTTEPWCNSKSSEAPAQLTIFYGGSVNVFNHISPEKAQAIMFWAGNAATNACKMTQPGAEVQVPASKKAGENGVPGNQPANTPPGSALSSPMSVSSHPVGQSRGGSSTDEEVKVFKPAGVSCTPASKIDPPKMVTSRGPLISSDVPQARKASLARFLEKRKERAMNSMPYNVSNKSAECATLGSNNAAHSVCFGDGAAGSLTTNKENGHDV